MEAEMAVRRLSFIDSVRTQWGSAIGRWYRPYFRISAGREVNAQREQRYKGIVNTIV